MKTNFKLRKTIGLIAPSGQVLQAETIDRAAEYLASQGLSVVAHESVWSQHERFAGDETLRAEAFNHFACDGHDVVMAVRGGYGLSRILDRLDYKQLAKSGSCFVGHSDFTAFHLAYLAKTGQVSFAGPMACYDYGQPTVSAFTHDHCWHLLSQDTHRVVVKSKHVQPTLHVKGTIWGGNLSLVTHLLGTPYFPKIKQGILFLEDVNEHPYRVERMIYQLLHAGVIGQQQALLLGSFNEYQLSPNDAGYDFDSMVQHLRNKLPIPVLTDLPFGHIRDKITLPVGGQVELVAAKKNYELTFSHYPNLLG